MAFADKSKELREDFKLTQSQLAQKLHLSRACISMIEIGRNEPTANTLLAYANYFGITVDELLERDKLTPEEKAAGALKTIKKSITPIEDDMLYVFRRLGTKHGEEIQRSIITMIEKML